ncbi:MAG: DUF134 domain-containing protein [Bacteroidota bacterium]
MPRPKRKRKMMDPPRVRGFRPFGGADKDDNPVKLLYEEYEALRLADYKNLSQMEAAKLMDVSRPTFTRIYDRALKKLAKALNESRSFIIEGGNVHFDDQWYRCFDCHSVFKTNRKERKNCAICGSGNIQHINATMEKTDEIVDFCVCENCGVELEHERGIPCRDLVCPECNNKMNKAMS